MNTVLNLSNYSTRKRANTNFFDRGKKVWERDSTVSLFKTSYIEHSTDGLRSERLRDQNYA